MARGETQQTNVCYQGSNEEFLVFIDDLETYKKWQSDSSIPLAHFISSFKIFLGTYGQGADGTYDAASNATLENEFGTSVDDEVIRQILQKGTLRTTDFPERQGSRNDSKGPMGGH